VSKPAYLVLENGKVFEGKFFGAEKEAVGEIVFNTGMTGYIETLTDSCYFGQIVLQTFPMVGNYGIISEDFESPSIKASAYIVKSWCEDPSNFRSEGKLDAFLKSQGIPGLYGIDTREVAKIIRENGVMNAKITSDKNNIDFDEIKNYKITDAIKNVSCKDIKLYKSEKSRYTVVLIDVGTKESLKDALLKKGCDVYIVPYNTTAEQIKSLNSDGIILSSGPGNPVDNVEIINNLKEIAKLNIPIFAVGLGHQILALAHGFKTQKLKYGHRGANQPVKNLNDGKTYITNQNHGYVVMPESINENIAQILFENVNDKTCEGIIYKDKLIFSTEFYPETKDSPGSTGFLYDWFIENMKKNRK
jgi:carbamoyl-phosphate synthase small subunit